MVTAASTTVIVAVISLVGAIGAAALAAYAAYSSDKRKHHAEVNVILNKYRDPLLLAAVALRHKIKRLFLPEPEAVKDQEARASRLQQLYVNDLEEHELYPDNVNNYIVAHTAFLVGQFLSWVYILRLESQFLSI